LLALCSGCSVLWRSIPDTQSTAGYVGPRASFVLWGKVVTYACHKLSSVPILVTTLTAIWA